MNNLFLASVNIKLNDLTALHRAKVTGGGGLTGPINAAGAGAGASAATAPAGTGAAAEPAGTGAAGTGSLSTPGVNEIQFSYSNYNAHKL